MSIALVWFRQDLRCADNPALAMACERHARIIPLYIREKVPAVPMGAAQQWWLHHSLLALQQSLRALDLELCLREAEPLALLKELILTHQIEAVYWNRCYEPAQIQRDQRIKIELKNAGIKVISFNASLLHEPWEVLNKSGKAFKVFTPYWRTCLSRLAQAEFHIMRPCRSQTYLIPSDPLDAWRLVPERPNWAAEFATHWQPGEQGALHRLECFLDKQLSDYKEGRNIPSCPGTSRLSPHLHFGELSPRQIWRAVREQMCSPRCHLASAETFLAELGWREFAYQLLYHNPELPARNFKEQFDDFPWEQNDEYLQHWQKGLTGYPIVDAGMRELWHTGYMHNRVRMIAASFLTKDLLIDWRTGMAWFGDTLLDADLANNSASWQWVAGSGADAAPYYRIFNPVRQGEQFDPQGEYVRTWIPELASMPNQWIHHPWDAPKTLRASTNYPEPLVDHHVARQRALESYKQLKVRNPER